MQKECAIKQVLQLKEWCANNEKEIMSYIGQSSTNMIEILDLLNNSVERDRVKIDNAIFQLHYKLTFILLTSFFAMFSSKQHFGNSIECMTKDIPANIINTFCWMSTTFTEEKNQIITYAYFQWISIVLFIQGLFFYIPRYLWKRWEDEISKRSIDNHTDNKFPTSVFQNSTLYAYKYFFCEILNLIKVFCLIIFTDYFLEGKFLLYGFQRNKKKCFLI